MFVPTFYRIAALLLTCLAALAFIPDGGCEASPERLEIRPDATISIVYTAGIAGFHHGYAKMNETTPLFIGPDSRGSITSDGFLFDTGVLFAQGFYLWAPGGALTAPEARSLFEGGALAIEGSGREVRTLVSDYAALFEDPDEEPPWIVDWLAAKAHEDGDFRMPDARTGRGAVFTARSPGGKSVQIFSPDGARVPSEILADRLAWQWVGGARLPVRRGQREYQLHSFGRRFGGFALRELTRRFQAERQALRVDAGNLVDDLASPLSEVALEETFAELAQSRFDALVPYINELRLDRERQRRLSELVPLVAANLRAPPGVRLQPFIVRENKGLRLAIVGMADVTDLAHLGLIGGASGWEGEEPEKALPRVLDAVRSARADAVVVVTNVAEERLRALQSRAFGVCAFITRHPARVTFQYRETVDLVDPERTRRPRPSLVVGVAEAQAGILELAFERRDARPAIVRLSNEAVTASNDMPYDHERAWRAFDIASAYIASHSDEVLPDIRLLPSHGGPLLDAGGEPVFQFRAEQWSRLAASCLRRAAGAEAAVIRRLERGSQTVGAILRYTAEEWLPGQARATAVELTGAELGRLTSGGLFATAGFDRERGLVGGRPLNPAERYRVATTETLAALAGHGAAAESSGMSVAAAPRPGGVATPEGGQHAGETLRGIVLARLDEMKARHGGFTAEYLAELRALLGDDGRTFEPIWTLALEPLEGKVQQFQVSNRAPYGAVRNSQVNTPDNSSYGGKTSAALIFETADLAWESRAGAAYQRTELQAGTRLVAQEQNDSAQLSSELRLKAFQLQTPRSALALIPFVNAALTTEFTPTTDPGTGKDNPRRQEIGSALGVVLYPGAVLEEFRVGAIARNDLAASIPRIEPGVQIAGRIEQPVGPAVLALEADVRNYFQTPEDTAADLGFLGQFGAGLRFPISGGLSLRVGADAFVFRGKVAETLSFGSSLMPTVGLSYNATWKPQFGTVF